VRGKLSALDLTAVAICALAWGTTWFTITLQLGVVDPVVSLVYRFTLAALVLASWTLLRHEAIRLNGPQHAAAAGVGLFMFAADYACTYAAELRIVSGLVALIFATLAFVNLVVFRVLLGQRAPRHAWVAAAVGAAGVALLSWSEIMQSRLDSATVIGIALAFGAVLLSGIGNVFAYRGEAAGAPLAASTAWGMAYGALALALYAVVTGKHWSFEPTARYVLSLCYLALVASVLAFTLYFGLARRCGYTMASYILALTPLLAMAMSVLFEHKRWPPVTLVGVALVLWGQWQLLRTRPAAAAPVAPMAPTLIAPTRIAAAPAPLQRRR
jgi:drug/metabolite transporter (DMT)-like permease